MSLEQKITAHSTPNSHRRQKTPARHAVTPQTPHVMVRRSAGHQYNLSQDMMAKTLVRKTIVSQFRHIQKIKTQKLASAVSRLSFCQKWQMP
jgi:hypothetical protein